MRIRSRWNNKRREQTIEENAGALAFIEWRIGSQTLLNLENEGFQTDTQMQRLDVLQELSAFLIHVTDRLVHGELDEQQRQTFIVELAMKMADTYHDNRVDAEGRGQDFRPGFIEVLNRRLADYAECSFDDGQPGYEFKRYLGECVTNVMGDRDRKWISDQVMDVEIPEMLKNLKKSLENLFVSARAEEAAKPRRGDGEQP